jgi:hypothetical protein
MAGAPGPDARAPLGAIPWAPRPETHASPTSIPGLAELQKPARASCLDECPRSWTSFPEFPVRSSAGLQSAGLQSTDLPAVASPIRGPMWAYSVAEDWEPRFVGWPTLAIRTAQARKHLGPITSMAAEPPPKAALLLAGLQPAGLQRYVVVPLYPEPESPGDAPGAPDAKPQHGPTGPHEDSGATGPSAS